MSKKHIAYIFLALSAIIGWNMFLIQRDQKLFEAYNQATLKERYCQQQANWNPDCNVE
jgi:hypothetical protein